MRGTSTDAQRPPAGVQGGPWGHIHRTHVQEVPAGGGAQPALCSPRTSPAPWSACSPMGLSSRSLWHLEAPHLFVVRQSGAVAGAELVHALLPSHPPMSTHSGQETGERDGEPAPGEVASGCAQPPPLPFPCSLLPLSLCSMEELTPTPPPPPRLGEPESGPGKTPGAELRASFPVTESRGKRELGETGLRTQRWGAAG